MSKTVKLINAHAAITPVMGNAVWLLKKLTIAVVSDPIPICMPPINADAVPAFLLKGASERADEFGKVKPWQQRNKNIKNIVLNNSSQPSREPKKKGHACHVLAE
jgi:hypothetical protein